jgi:hypothetical protein
MKEQCSNATHDPGCECGNARMNTAESKSAPAPGLSCAWIDVTEKLPETHQIVLLWNADSEMVELGTYNSFKGELITHWMPLPEPPQAT